MSELDTYKQLMQKHAEANMKAYGNKQAHQWFAAIAAEEFKATTLPDIDDALQAKETNKQYEEMSAADSGTRQYGRQVGMIAIVELYTSTRRAFRRLYLAGADGHIRTSRDHDRFASFGHANAGGVIQRLNRWIVKLLGASK